MTPAEKFARIRYEDMGFKEPYEELEPEIKADEERTARKQIRALAEMTPSKSVMDKMIEADYGGDIDEIIAACRGYNLICAAEGEQK
jgi:hypothetical protein